MWRTRAIQTLMVEEVAALRPDRPEAGEDARPLLAAAVEAAKRRAVLIVAVEWVALAVLLATRGLGTALPALGPTQEAIFTLGVLVVAAHSGFRLGQLEKFRAVERACAELDDREP